MIDNSNTLSDTGQPVDPTLLREAFESFMATSKAMEKAYYELQEKVKLLNLELEEKNRQLSAQLAETERARTQLSDMLASLDLAVVVFDGHGRLARLNRGGEELFGLDHRTAVGLTIDRLLDRRFADISGRHILEDADRLLEETEIGSLDDPAGRVLRVSTHRMRGMGENEGRILLAEDITELAVRRAAAERNQRLAAMGEMAVQIVHQIRNPMGSIELFASMLRRDLSGEPQTAELAAKVQQGIKSLNLIISNLLSFAKGAEPAILPVDLPALLETVRKEIEHLAASRGVHVIVTVDSAAMMVRVDPELWRQVLLNLAVNAVEAMPSGGELRFTVSREWPEKGPSTVKTVVTDTGRGMTPEVRERVFHPFFSTKDRGAGVGLALVHNIVKAHGGVIEVESAEGKGSTFTIRVPENQ